MDVIPSTYYIIRWHSIVEYSVVGYSGHTRTEYLLNIISYMIRWHSIVGYSVVGYSGQTSTEYPLHMISYMIRWHSIVGYSVVGYSGQTWTEYPLHVISYMIRWHSIVGYSRCWVFLTVTDDIPLLGIPLLSIPVILPGIPNDQNTQLICWVFPPLGIPDVGYSVQLPYVSIPLWK